MASPTVTFRVSEEMIEEMRQMAITFGDVNDLDGAANLSAYLRRCHRHFKRQYEQRLVVPGAVNYPPDELEMGQAS